MKDNEIVFQLLNNLTHSSDRTREITELTPKSVAHGKTFNDKEELFAAAYAVDGDLSTVAATETENGAGWLKLEFDKHYFIHKVVIYNRFYTNWYHPGDYCMKSKARFMECLDGDNNVDVSVYQGEVLQKSCGTLQLTYGLEQSDQIYTLVCNIMGNSVILSKNEGFIVIYEVVVTSIGKTICFPFRVFFRIE